MQQHLRILARPAFWVTTLLSVGILVGCDDARKAIVTKMSNTTGERNAKLEQSLQSALATSTNAQVLAWHEFLTKWPLARQRQGFAWYEELKKFQGNVAAATLIEDRYIFRAIMDFEISSNFENVTFSKLRFQFTEVKRVVLPPEGAAEGGVSMSFQPNTKWLGLVDWKRFVESNWSFSTIGIVVVSNAPIQNIQAAIPNL